MMFSRQLTATALSSCLLTTVLGTLAISNGGGDRQPQARIALQNLQSAFHGASAAGDYELMHGLWTRDAVFSGGGNVIKGRDKIADFFRNGPDWGKTANLAPTYKSIFDIRGNKATIRFECVVVRVKGSSSLTTPLSTLPPGSQNKDVEIVQHSNTTIEAVKQGDQWLIKTFTGKGGPIM